MKKNKSNTIRLTDEALKIVKVRAASEGKDMRGWLSQLVLDFHKGLLIRISNNKSNIKLVEDKALSEVLAE